VICRTEEELSAGMVPLTIKTQAGKTKSSKNDTGSCADGWRESSDVESDGDCP